MSKRKSPEILRKSEEDADKRRKEFNKEMNSKNNRATNSTKSSKSKNSKDEKSVKSSRRTRRTRSSSDHPSCSVCRLTAKMVVGDSSRGTIACDVCNADIKPDEARYTCVKHCYDENGQRINKNIWDRCICCETVK